MQALLVIDMEQGFLNVDRSERNNPDAEKKFVLDSKAPTQEYKDFLKGEVRYTSLALKNPEKAETLFEKAEEYAKERYTYLQKLITLYGDE